MGLLEHSEGLQIHASDGTGLGKHLVRRSPNPQGWRCKGPNTKPLKETQQEAKDGRPPATAPSWPRGDRRNQGR